VSDDERRTLAVKQAVDGAALPDAETREELARLLGGAR